MVKISEGTFTVDGQSLYTKTWLPENGPRPRARLVVIHGFSDHVGRYYGFFPYLAGRGVAVYGLDQRGWGRSVRRAADRGRTGPTARVLADMAAFIRDRLSADSESDSDSGAVAGAGAAAGDAPPPPPLFVLGHSMGGGQALTLACTAEYDDLTAQVRGWVLEAPFLGFAPELQPHWLTVAGGRLASHVVPHFRLVRAVPPEDVSRDPAVRRSLAADPLAHNTGTLEGLAGMLDRAAALSSSSSSSAAAAGGGGSGGGVAALGPRPGGPLRSLLLAHGTADRVTSFESARAWFDRPETAAAIPDRTFVPYEGMYHQLHADYGKETFYKDVADWILERAGGGGNGSGGGGGAPESKL